MLGLLLGGRLPPPGGRLPLPLAPLLPVPLAGRAGVRERGPGREGGLRTGVPGARVSGRPRDCAAGIGRRHMVTM